MVRFVFLSVVVGVFLLGLGYYLLGSCDQNWCTWFDWQLHRREQREGVKPDLKGAPAPSSAATYQSKNGEVSFRYDPKQWFKHEETQEYTLFANEPHEAGMAHDRFQFPHFTLSTSAFGDLKGAKTKEEWLEAVGAQKLNPLFVSREDVTRNGQPMTRLVMATSGVGGDVLMYVSFLPQDKVVVTTFAPYKPGETYTQSFEDLVNTFEFGARKDSTVSVQQLYEHKAVYTSDMSQDQAPYKADCAKRGGTFKECGSPCAPNAEMCVQICAYTCEW